MTLRALLLSDVEDSTALARTLGETRAAALWTEHDRRARDLLAAHDGRELGRGDGLFLLFDDALHAARYALAYQSVLRSLGLAARVGLHVGAVALRPNTAGDIARGAPALEAQSPATPITARLMALARGGQILLSAEAGAAIGSGLPAHARVEAHGHYRMKGLEVPLEVHELGVDALTHFQPPPDMPKAYRVVRRGDLWLPAREVRHNLPAERDAFVGRIAELRAIADRLAHGERLVTLLGPGGTGKTRTVSRYAWTWLGEWRVALTSAISRRRARPTASCSRSPRRSPSRSVAPTLRHSSAMPSRLADAAL